jgi:predicted RNase H-like HicB family nuclease
MSKFEKLLAKGLSGKASKRTDIKIQTETLTMNHKYEIIIYWNKEDNAFIAEVPELTGCMSDGKSYEDALQNVQTVIEEWIETAKSLGRQIPESKGKLLHA